MEAGSHGGVHEINADGLDALIQFFADQVRNALLCKNHVIVRWFIRNHAQRGPASAAAGRFDPNGRDLRPKLEKLLDHLRRFFSHFEHLLLHDKIEIWLIITDP